MLEHRHQNLTLAQQRIDLNVDLLGDASVHQQHQGETVLHTLTQNLVRHIGKCQNGLAHLGVLLLNFLFSYAEEIIAWDVLNFKC